MPECAMKLSDSVSEIGNFDLWSKYQDQNETIFNINMKHFGNIRGKSVIDFGCGDGSLLKSCLDLGASRVIGLDKSPLMIRLAQQNIQWSADKCSLRVQDCSKPFIMGNNFDFAFSHSLQNCSTHDEFQTHLSNMWNCLIEGGMAIVCMPRMAKDELEQMSFSEPFGFVLPLKQNNSDSEPKRWTVEFLTPDVEKGGGFINKPWFTAFEYGWSDKILLRTMCNVGFTDVELLDPKVSVTQYDSTQGKIEGKKGKRDFISMCCLLAVGKK